LEKPWPLRLEYFKIFIIITFSCKVILLKDDVVVAKMDATINELPHTKVRLFPTIKLYKKETNEAVEYNGESKKI